MVPMIKFKVCDIILVYVNFLYHKTFTTKVLILLNYF